MSINTVPQDEKWLQMWLIIDNNNGHRCRE